MPSERTPYGGGAAPHALLRLVTLALVGALAGLVALPLRKYAHEYTRVYSYWQDQSGLVPLPAFTEGYSATKSVALTTCEVQSDSGAGQRNYRVPVTIQLHERWFGTNVCRMLRAASEQPADSIATIQLVAAGENPTNVMNKSCQ